MPLGMLGKYERLDVLGHGVSGIVYLARDTLLNKQVALKVVDVQAGDVRRFLEEARVMDRLSHPNIVRVNGVDRIEGKTVIDMEYVKGQNLHELLLHEGRLPQERALRIAIQILDALDYAHRMQTVHRDIKPANILIARDETVKLVDFGLAEILATNAYAGGAGTYAYMAPEDFAEDDRSDHLSDIWAVGITLFEMLTGHRPYQVAKAKDPFAWKRTLETDSPAKLADYNIDLPVVLQQIVNRALAVDKRQRYQSAGAFRDDLRQVAEGQGVSEETTHFRPSHRRASKPAPAREESTRPGTRTGPGVVVADIHNNADETVASPATRSIGWRPRLPFAANREIRLSVEPGKVDFGAVRKGETTSVRLQTRSLGISGNVHGRVLVPPGWLAAHPTLFDKSRQTITLTAHSDRVWETGEFQETVRIETDAGVAEIPVRLLVQQARPTFSQIAVWYVPLLTATLLPTLAVALGADHLTTSAMTSLVPWSAVATGLLSLMLLLICVAVDAGSLERGACVFLMATMCFVLGVTAARAHTVELMVGLERGAIAGCVIGIALVLQILYLSRWRIWAGVVLCLGLLMGGALLHTLFAT